MGISKMLLANASAQFRASTRASGSLSSLVSFLVPLALSCGSLRLLALDIRIVFRLMVCEQVLQSRLLYSRSDSHARVQKQ